MPRPSQNTLRWWGYLSPFILAGWLALVFWGGKVLGMGFALPVPAMTTILLVYLAIQAFAAVARPAGANFGMTIDEATSVVPLFVIVAAIIWAPPFSPYEFGLVWNASVTCLIDVLLFSTFMAKISLFAEPMVMQR